MLVRSIENRRVADMHREVPVMVNAWVDEGVAPLVIALNGVDRLVTVDSCEGTDGPAHVMFGYQGPDDRFVAVVAELARVLAANACGAEYRLQLQWANGGEHPLATLLVFPAFMPEVVDALAVASSDRGLSTRRCPRGLGAEGEKA